MSATQIDGQPGDVVEKVLRRAEVARMARLLQNRLALASFKAKHGWENLNLDTIEPRIDNEIRQRRPGSSSETVSDSSSNLSDPYFPTGLTSSSPLTGPIFSDDAPTSGSTGGYRKRTLTQAHFDHPVKRKRAGSATAAAQSWQGSKASWKDMNNLPQSSPVYHRQHPHFPVSHGANLSFVSATSTIPNRHMSPDFTNASDDEDHHLPVHSFQVQSPRIRSSPPRTPPPTRARSSRLRQGQFHTLTARNPETGEEGADLLLYLASSPSPANPGMKARVFPPSTPPSRNLALPSSMMTTPSGGFMNGFGPNTPSPAFNFADFVNITPSPAQAAWGSRTPVTTKTPLAAREARRRLNFDALGPPIASPSANGRNTGGTKQKGLGMELGGELIS
ncbi:MAG: hypothetical protein M1837_004920 [Sclerophora amabilis]|nr:MAG: hypothetical protein M1837_004920 [Sclerophora amabilis]